MEVFHLPSDSIHYLTTNTAVRTHNTSVHVASKHAYVRKSNEQSVYLLESESAYKLFVSDTNSWRVNHNRRRALVTCWENSSATHQRKFGGAKLASSAYKPQGLSANFTILFQLNAILSAECVCVCEGTLASMDARESKTIQFQHPHLTCG